MSYRLALVSHIPVVAGGRGYTTLDLWARDLEAQAEAVGGVTLFCPVDTDASSATPGSVALAAAIAVVDVAAPRAIVEAAVADCDLVQIAGNFSWRESGAARRFLRLAHRLGKPVILGISSHRAKTAVMNAASQGRLRRARAGLRYASIRCSQSFLAWRADGVFVVGEGLRPLVARWNANVFVATASWIRRADLGTTRVRPAGSARTFGVACRLEAMKGVHVAIEAWARVAADPSFGTSTLRVIGDGPEGPRLRDLAQRLGVAKRVRFEPALSYPDAFFGWLRQIDVLLLTNLNDEQPRVVFDAISQGCLLLCPATPPFRQLGLPAALLYDRGDAEALAARMRLVVDDDAAVDLHAALSALARGATIETMHAERAAWVDATVLAPGASAARRA